MRSRQMSIGHPRFASRIRTRTSNAESGLPYVIRSADWKSRVFSECVTASWVVSPSSRNTFGGYVIAHENSRLDGQCVDATFVANEMKMAVVFSSFKQISTNRCQL